jgi:glutamate carboxypeptidase
MSIHTPFIDDAPISTLTDWAALESPTRAVDAINAMASLVEQAAGDALAGERIAVAGFGDMLILRGGPQNGKPPGLLLGHLDTVHAIGTAATGLPIRRDGMRLYGPGLYDMKAGIWIALQALLAQTMMRPIIFALAPDEEVGSPGSRAITEDLARGAAYALVLEPAREGGGCVTCRKGVGRFEIDVEGVAAHAGVRHEAGRSAITEAAHQILKIEALTDYAQGLTANVGLVNGGTTVNTVPQHCRFTVDIRAPTPQLCNTAARTITSLTPITADTRLTVRGGIARPPYERREANVALYRKAQEIANTLGLPFHEAPRTGGGSDGNFTAAMGIPTLDGLGADGAGAHTLNEYIDLTTLDVRARLIAGLLETL